MEDLIKRSDAIKIMACEMYAEAQSQGYEVDSIEDFMPEAKVWMNDAPSADRPTVIRVKSIMKKEDYESLADIIRQQALNAIVIPHNAELVTPADRPQGEWIEVQKYNYRCSECGKLVTRVECTLDNYCPNCGADMRGKEDE